MTFPVSKDLNMFMIGAHKFFVGNVTIDYEMLLKINPFNLFYLPWIKRRAVEMMVERIDKILKWSKILLTYYLKQLKHNNTERKAIHVQSSKQSKI